ncbi:MAG: helix-turn-helix domain-containing protein [Candidatus Eisenbacteria bacterium]|jgi:transposase|nr:helix-turn-helix domain-containing protein [Candidatus Eisenbacteria bacterium]
MKRPENAKRAALRKCGALNPSPEAVVDPLFQESDFFDAEDLVQVKYEMLRRVRADHTTVSQTARAFGFSRPSFYQSQAAFKAHGLTGLVPRKRGPRQGHKVTPAVVAYLTEVLERDGPTDSLALAGLLRQQFGLSVHRRTIERALARKKKPQ